MLRFSNQVQRVISVMLITPQELETMVTSAAIASLRGANRRYHQWLFELDVDQQFVKRMFRHVDGWKTHHRTIKHRQCDGQGCQGCGWSGRLMCN